MKRPMMRYALAALGVLTVFSRCECEKIFNPKYSIVVKNNSNHGIEIYVPYDYRSGDTPVYPDTLLPLDEVAAKVEVAAGEDISYGMLAIKIGQFIADLPGDTLSVFVFHADTLAKYPWEQVRREYKILKRYDLSAEDARRLGSRITYPPDASMKGIRIYPK